VAGRNFVLGDILPWGVLFGDFVSRGVYVGTPNSIRTQQWNGCLSDVAAAAAARQIIQQRNVMLSYHVMSYEPGLQVDV